ncbi:MAG: hypothetical protein Q9159_000513 [Coniocarpon cinnabarinum]
MQKSLMGGFRLRRGRRHQTLEEHEEDREQHLRIESQIANLPSNQTMSSQDTQQPSHSTAQAQTGESRNNNSPRSAPPQENPTTPEEEQAAEAHRQRLVQLLNPQHVLFFLYDNWADLNRLQRFERAWNCRIYPRFGRVYNYVIREHRGVNYMVQTEVNSAIWGFLVEAPTQEVAARIMETFKPHGSLVQCLVHMHEPELTQPEVLAWTRVLDIRTLARRRRQA